MAECPRCGRECTNVFPYPETGEDLCGECWEYKLLERSDRIDVMRKDPDITLDDLRDYALSYKHLLGDLA